MGKKTAMFAVALLSVTAAVNAAPWFWGLGGARSPSDILTSGGQTLFPTTGYSQSVPPIDPTCDWGSVTTVEGQDTAMRIVDNNTGKKVLWTANGGAIPQSGDLGMTLAFRIKADSTDFVASAPSGGKNVFACAESFAGKSTNARFSFRMYKDSSSGNVMIGSRDYSTGKAISDGAWHDVWIKALWNGSNFSYTMWFDGASWGSYTKSSTDSVGASLGFDGTGEKANFQLDYLVWAIDGAYNVNNGPDAMPTVWPGVPEPATLSLLALAAMSFIGRRRVR